MALERQGLLKAPPGKAFYDAAEQKWTELNDSLVKKGGTHFPFNETEVALYFEYKRNIQLALAAKHPLASKNLHTAVTFLEGRAKRLDAPVAVRSLNKNDRLAAIEFFEREANELSGLNSCCCTLS